MQVMTDDDNFNFYAWRSLNIYIFKLIPERCLLEVKLARIHVMYKNIIYDHHNFMNEHEHGDESFFTLILF